jgi:hypothetical protein
MKNNIAQIGVAAFLVFFLICLVDPFMLWMPGMLGMAVLLCASLLLIVWAGFVMREEARDEREAMHRMNAGRIAYLSGVGVLTVALFVQGIMTHHIDPWIALALGVMVLAKLVAHLYADKYQ